MKRIASILLVLLTIISCQTEPKGYQISAKIDGVPTGKKVSLKAIKNNQPVLLDTTIIKDGTFTFEGLIVEPDIHIMTIQGVQGSLPFILENKNLDILLYKDSLALSKIEGSKENDVAQSYMLAVSKFRKKNDALMIQFNEAKKANDTQFLQSFRNKRQELKIENDKFNLEFVEENSNSLFALLMLENLSKLKAIDVKELDKFYNSFPSDLQESSVGLRIKEKIESSLATEVGSVAPDFTAPNPDGKEITLSKIKGKVTIIDFWAAWCGPCRKENPNLVKVYDKYHEKGLEIIGVSLDGNSRQKEPRSAWLNAIEKDGLTWHQVSNLNYFNDPVAKKYNIQSIPATFILDSEGKIIYKNLRGPALEKTISELLD